MWEGYERVQQVGEHERESQKEIDRRIERNEPMLRGDWFLVQVGEESKWWPTRLHKAGLRLGSRTQYLPGWQ